MSLTSWLTKSRLMERLYGMDTIVLPADVKRDSISHFICHCLFQAQDIGSMAQRLDKNLAIVPLGFESDDLPAAVSEGRRKEPVMRPDVNQHQVRSPERVSDHQIEFTECHFRFYPRR